MKRPYWRVHKQVIYCWRHYLKDLIQTGQREGKCVKCDWLIKGPTEYLEGPKVMWCADCYEEGQRQVEEQYPWENGLLENKS